jgi:hypothetical protein
MQKVQTAEQALNGNQNVEHAKTQALADLEHLTSLNNAQKVLGPFVLSNICCASLTAFE